MELSFLKPLNLYVRTVSGTFKWNLLTLMWNLDLKPLCGTFTRNLYTEPLCEVFIRNLHAKPFAKRFGRTFMWNFGNLNHSVEPRNPYLWNLGTCKSGTLMWNLGEPELLRVEPLMWNLGELELLRVEPQCETLGNLVPGFGWLPQTTPKLYWKKISSRKPYWDLNGLIEKSQNSWGEH